MTNFNYLKSEPQFNTFADVSILAEELIHRDPATSILTSRRAAEFAIKWMYSVDEGLARPYRDNLNSLMHTPEFRKLVGDDF